MKIIIDAYGGDHSPVEMVKGAIQAVNTTEDVEIIITGDKEQIESLLKENGYVGNRIEVCHAPDTISCEESPTMAIRKKKESSLVVGLNMLKEREDIIAMISAGSTGAVLAGGLFIVGRIKGVKRPALAPFLPTVFEDKKTLLIDCGANVDCKPEYLEQFAIMGSIYAESMRGINSPKVALLSNGVEETKGNDQVHKAYELLKNNNEINFVGNIEGRDLFSGEVDVVVSDGFTGNVAMKAAEGTMNVFTDILKQEIVGGGLFAKLGYLLLKKPLKRLKKRINYTEVGGSPFIGLNKILIKSHGSSKANTIYTCVLQAVEIHKSNYIEKMKEGIEKSSISGEKE